MSPSISRLFRRFEDGQLGAPRFLTEGGLAELALSSLLPAWPASVVIRRLAHKPGFELQTGDGCVAHGLVGWRFMKAAYACYQRAHCMGYGHGHGYAIAIACGLRRLRSSI